MGLLDKLKYSLAKTRATLISAFVSPKWDEGEMERGLLGADFGPKLTSEIIAGIKRRLELKPGATREDALRAAREEVTGMFGAPSPLLLPQPVVLLLVGVNGAGKTTTAAKIAHRFQSEGGRVLLAAADTFRAAAIEQLKLWGTRLKTDVVSTTYGGDPGAVAHDAVKRLQTGSHTHLVIDTAGRQHTKTNLVQELQKVKRVIAKAMPGAPHEVWLVVDAPTGGNAISQAREFHAAMGLTGIILTKLDGTAKGGMALAIHRETGLPIRFIGVGESLEDLELFDARTFADAMWTASD